ncbi:TipAS antibiotic-recognition domain-containing protein [Nocardia sp. NPDC024068]|uniref:MerR family transcriptional regulator n=1 Tax=Nocardia sp. NPDC024068 TaxID=3157197 RepID=UPI0033D266DA
MTAGSREGEWSIQDLAKAAGTTSRTLRHYGEMGLLPPSRIGLNGYRYYDEAALVRLQRILLLRELGVGLPVIGRILSGESDAATALRAQLELLRQERDRIGRRIESVHTTLGKLERGERLVAAEVFEEFDHTQYQDEVTERWGADAYRSGDRWWRSLSTAEKRAFQQAQLDIASDFGRAHREGLPPGDPEVQAITARHYEWVTGGWQGRRPDAHYFAGLGEMYVADERFGANYDAHGTGTAEFVRDAMRIYADNNLE